MTAKRKKDPEYYQLRDALEQIANIAEAYRARLQAELAAERAAPVPYAHLVRALERQIETAGRLELLLEERAWDVLIELANGSAYVAHTRTRDFF